MQKYVGTDGTHLSVGYGTAKRSVHRNHTQDGVGTVPYSVQHNGTASDEVHPFWKIFIVTLCRKMDAQWGLVGAVALSPPVL